jgi:hypothetical protein
MIMSQRDRFKKVYEEGHVKEGDDGQMMMVGDQVEQERLKTKRSKPKRRANIEPESMNLDDVDIDKEEGDLE